MIVKPLRLPLAAYLEVRTGRPLTPLAPVRAGLVEDEAFAAFLAVCRETLFTHLVGLGADEVTVPTVRGLFRLWPERARSESPFLLAQRLRPFDRRRGVDQVYDLRRHEVVLLPREALPATPLLASHLLIVGTSEVAGDPEPLVAEHGLVTLLAAAGQEAVLPDPETGVPYERVAWWRPGPTTVLPGTLSLHASDSGHWGLGTDTQPPPVWLPLPPGAPILAVIEADSYDIDAAEFVAASPDPVALLQIHGRLAFCRDDEEADESEQSFHDSVDILVRRLLGDAVPRLDLDPLRCLLGFEAGRVAEIRFDYDPEHPSDDRYVALVVRTVTGVTRRLRVYA